MKVKVRDFEMAYEDTGGDGMPLLLIHGFPLDRTMWAAQTHGLTDVARVIAPDLRGLGESALPAGAVTMDTYAEDLRGLLDALGVGNAVVAGLSMGGYIAFAYYRKHAHRVRALILADTRASADAPEEKKGRDAAASLARDKGMEAIVARMMPRMLAPSTVAERPAIADAARAMMARQPVEGVVAALIAMRERADSALTLGEISVPTLIVVGAEDTLTPPKDAEAMRSAIRRARLVTIPGAAHLSNCEQPDAFNLVVREFVRSVGAGTAI